MAIWIVKLPTRPDGWVMLPVHCDVGKVAGLSQLPPSSGVMFAMDTAPRLANDQNVLSGRTTFVSR
jgi:hypothetical protein